MWKFMASPKIKFLSLIIMLFLFECEFIPPLSGQVSAQDGWFWQYPKPQGNTLRDIFVFDQTTAIAVGDVGTVIQTADGGKNWDVQHHAGGTSYGLYSVCFIDSMNGWAAGGVWYRNKNVLIKTTDGGKNWTEVKTETDLPLNAVYFVDVDTGFVVGEDGIILRTTDGGSSWDTRKIDDYIGYYLDVFRLLAVTFVDKQTGWIVGAGYYGNEIYKTTDCGRTWEWNERIVNPKIYTGLYDICFIDKENGFIIGDMGVFLKTTDGGTSWQYQNLWEKYQKTQYQFFYSVFFTDSTTGWIVGGDYYAFILKTTDGGENWVEEANNNNEMIHHFYKARFTDKDNGWIVGQFGMIYRTTDDGVNWAAQRDEKYGFNSISFIDENTGWAVGGKGIILHTKDGGTNWYKQNQNDSLLLSSLYAIDDQNVFAVGAVIKGTWPAYTRNGVILRTTNGGQTWAREAFDTLSEFSSIIFLNDSTGWTTVSSGILLKTTNKGYTWEIFASGLGTILDKIQFINKNTGWISFYSGKNLLKTVDGGQNWDMKFIDSSFSMYSVYFVDANNGWTVGSYGGKNNIFKTTDGGDNWIPSGTPPISHYSSVYFINENTGWAVGGYRIVGQLKSTIIKTTDGGDNWITQKSPSKGGISSTYFINENTGWAAGDGIIKTTNGGGVVSVKDEKEFRNNVPEQIELFQNYPNPFNPSTAIGFQLSAMSFVQLKVYDILGREVAALVNENLNAGSHRVIWNASQMSSGVYIYQLTDDTQSISKKMILTK